MNEELKSNLAEMIKGSVLFDEPLSNHSTIKIGGKADVFVIPLDVKEMTKVINFAKESNFEFLIVGAGSNILFRDNGFDGIIISTAKLNTFEVKEKDEKGIVLESGAGVAVNDLVNFSIEEGVTGLESLAGIPGTVGGALVMNAGTHNGSISDPLISVIAFDKAGKMYQWPKDKIEYGYRHAKYPKSCIIVSAQFQLNRFDKSVIEKRVNELRERRKQRHPLSWPSLGSIFKNPGKKVSAGQLIEEAGLKGIRVGGARIANEHGNWIINEDGATARDVEVLIHLVREKVKETSDILLEPEIVIIGKR